MHDDERYDERLLLVIVIASIALLAFFLAMPVLRVYYALLMPLTLGLSAGTAWWLLRGGTGS